MEQHGFNEWNYWHVAESSGGNGLFPIYPESLLEDADVYRNQEEWGATNQNHEKEHKK